MKCILNPFLMLSSIGKNKSRREKLISRALHTTPLGKNKLADSVLMSSGVLSYGP